MINNIAGLQEAKNSLVVFTEVHRSVHMLHEEHERRMIRLVCNAHALSRPSGVAIPAIPPGRSVALQYFFSFVNSCTFSSSRAQRSLV